MTPSGLSDPKPFDPLPIVACGLTLIAYTVCLVPWRFEFDNVNGNVVAGVFLGSLSAALSVWALMRRKSYYPDSARLALLNLVLGLPLSCCGWGVLGD